MTNSDLRTYATFDGHGGKVSQRVEVLDHTPHAAGPYAGLVPVRGAHPRHGGAGAAQEHRGWRD